jgi:predicted small secreted protein
MARILAALFLGASLLGGVTACGTIEGIGKDISDAARATKKIFD